MEKETLHLIQVLEATKQALKDQDSMKLKELSDQAIHSACGIQDSASITLVVLIYSLSKLIERKASMRIKNWNKFISKLNSTLDLAIKALKDNKQEKYEDYLIAARKSLEISINIKPYIQEIFRKASINKASKLYEHGISLGQTSKLLGISQWELADYTGQTKIPDTKQNITLDAKSRARMALEFFK